MESLKSIANSLNAICYDVDKNITGLSDEDATLWAKANSIRHAYTIKTILDYINSNNRKNLRILNASGIACGTQDFSIVNYLRRNLNLDFEWVVFESPESRFINNNLFKKYLKELKIKMILSDFSKIKADELYGKDEGAYDIVIFTEIAEHLDHSTFLTTLMAIRRVMKDDGILILTTPNLLSLPNRIHILLGNGDHLYGGDGTENLKKGIYGHIVFYDINRLTRLMNDVGLGIKKIFTFTFGRGPSEKETKMRMLIRISDFISHFVKNSKTNIFLVAKKSDPIKIPTES
jgi:SAM-dependent methyltransferase